MVEGTKDSKNTRNLISVIIVTWNAKEHVRACLSTLQKQCADSNLEVIVSDNASTDGTPELIASEFPKIKLLRNGANLGFAKGNNVAVRQSSGSYLCFVNSDVKFTSDCFTPMLAYMQEHPQIGMLGPRSLTDDGHIARSTMRFPTVWNSFCRALGIDTVLGQMKLMRGQLMEDFDHDSTCDVEILNGWFWMMPRKAMEEVGLMDEQFFIYGEDVDWCYRFHQAGKRVVFFAGAEAIHIGGASSSAAPLRFSLEMQRANWQYIRKHFGPLRQFGFFLTGLLNDGVRAIGHGLRMLLPLKNRDDAKLKFKRSLAGLSWLLRLSFLRN
jgi:GT2 family glycosyltransferase